MKKINVNSVPKSSITEKACTWSINNFSRFLSSFKAIETSLKHNRFGFHCCIYYKFRLAKSIAIVNWQSFRSESDSLLSVIQYYLYMAELPANKPTPPSKLPGEDVNGTLQDQKQNLTKGG